MTMIAEEAELKTIEKLIDDPNFTEKVNDFLLEFNYFFKNNKFEEFSINLETGEIEISRNIRFNNKFKEIISFFFPDASTYELDNIYLNIKDKTVKAVNPKKNSLDYFIENKIKDKEEKEKKQEAKCAIKWLTSEEKFLICKTMYLLVKFLKEENECPVNILDLDSPDELETNIIQETENIAIFVNKTTRLKETQKPIQYKKQISFV